MLKNTPAGYKKEYPWLKDCLLYTSWWMCPKGNFEEDPHAKVPKYIHFPEEHLMLLKEAK